ncbi:MAG: hypothetical protein K6F00_00090 [Lachnospiraceae bacterium]|nr:hypothetical protein [Lachnospiraceae bacterium]
MSDITKFLSKAWNSTYDNTIGRFFKKKELNIDEFNKQSENLFRSKNANDFITQRKDRMDKDYDKINMQDYEANLEEEILKKNQEIVVNAHKSADLAPSFEEGSILENLDEEQREKLLPKQSFKIADAETKSQRRSEEKILDKAGSEYVDKLGAREKYLLDRREERLNKYVTSRFYTRKYNQYFNLMSQDTRFGTQQDRDKEMKYGLMPFLKTYETSGWWFWKKHKAHDGSIGDAREYNERLIRKYTSKNRQDRTDAYVMMIQDLLSFKIEPQDLTDEYMSKNFLKVKAFVDRLNAFSIIYSKNHQDFMQDSFTLFKYRLFSRNNPDMTSSVTLDKLLKTKLFDLQKPMNDFLDAHLAAHGIRQDDLTEDDLVKFNINGAEERANARENQRMYYFRNKYSLVDPANAVDTSGINQFKADGKTRKSRKELAAEKKQLIDEDIKRKSQDALNNITSVLAENNKKSQELFRNIFSESTKHYVKSEVNAFNREYENFLKKNPGYVDRYHYEHIKGEKFVQDATVKDKTYDATGGKYGSRLGEIRQLLKQNINKCVEYGPEVRDLYDKFYKDCLKAVEMNAKMNVFYKVKEANNDNVNYSEYKGFSCNATETVEYIDSTTNEKKTDEFKYNGAFGEIMNQMSDGFVRNEYKVLKKNLTLVNNRIDSLYITLKYAINGFTKSDKMTEEEVEIARKELDVNNMELLKDVDKIKLHNTILRGALGLAEDRNEVDRIKMMTSARASHSKRKEIVERIGDKFQNIVAPKYTDDDVIALKIDALQKMNIVHYDSLENYEVSDETAKMIQGMIYYKLNYDKNQAEYENMRKTEPERYYDIKTKVQLFEDYSEAWSAALNNAVSDERAFIDTRLVTEMSDLDITKLEAAREKLNEQVEKDKEVDVNAANVDEEAVKAIGARKNVLSVLDNMIKIKKAKSRVANINEAAYNSYRRQFEGDDLKKKYEKDFGNFATSEFAHLYEDSIIAKEKWDKDYKLSNDDPNFNSLVGKQIVAFMNTVFLPDQFAKGIFEQKDNMVSLILKASEVRRFEKVLSYAKKKEGEQRDNTIEERIYYNLIKGKKFEADLNNKLKELMPFVEFMDSYFRANGFVNSTGSLVDGIRNNSLERLDSKEAQEAILAEMKKYQAMAEDQRIQVRTKLFDNTKVPTTPKSMLFEKLYQMGEEECGKKKKLLSSNNMEMWNRLLNDLVQANRNIKAGDDDFLLISEARRLKENADEFYEFTNYVANMNTQEAFRKTLKKYNIKSGIDETINLSVTISQEESYKYGFVEPVQRERLKAVLNEEKDEKKKVSLEKMAYLFKRVKLNQAGMPSNYQETLNRRENDEIVTDIVNNGIECDKMKALLVSTISEISAFEIDGEKANEEYMLKNLEKIVPMLKKIDAFLEMNDKHKDFVQNAIKGNNKLEKAYTSLVGEKYQGYLKSYVSTFKAISEKYHVNEEGSIDLNLTVEQAKKGATRSVKKEIKASSKESKKIAEEKVFQLRTSAEVQEMSSYLRTNVDLDSVYQLDKIKNDKSIIANAQKSNKTVDAYISSELSDTYRLLFEKHEANNQSGNIEGFSSFETETFAPMLTYININKNKKVKNAKNINATGLYNKFTGHVTVPADTKANLDNKAMGRLAFYKDIAISFQREFRECYYMLRAEGNKDFGTDGIKSLPLSEKELQAEFTRKDGKFIKETFQKFKRVLTVLDTLMVDDELIKIKEKDFNAMMKVMGADKETAEALKYTLGVLGKGTFARNKKFHDVENIRSYYVIMNSFLGSRGLKNDGTNYAEEAVSAQGLTLDEQEFAYKSSEDIMKSNKELFEAEILELANRNKSFWKSITGSNRVDKLEKEIKDRRKIQQKIKEKENK